MWWHPPLIPVFSRQRQEYRSEFEASRGYKERSCPPNTKANNNNNKELVNEKVNIITNHYYESTREDRQRNLPPGDVSLATEFDPQTPHKDGKSCPLTSLLVSQYTHPSAHIHNTKIITFYIKNSKCFSGITLLFPPKHSCCVSYLTMAISQMRKRRHRETELFRGTLLVSRKPGFEPVHSNSQSSCLKHYCKDLAIRKASVGTDANCDMFLSVGPLGS